MGVRALVVSGVGALSLVAACAGPEDPGASSGGQPSVPPTPPASHPGWPHSPETRPDVAQPPPISGGTLVVLKDGRTAVAADPDRDRVWIVDLQRRAVAG